MRWLVVYPIVGTPLPGAQREFDMVTSALDHASLSGRDVTLEAAARFFATHRASGFWFIGHSSREGLLTRDGIASAELVADWIRAAGIQEVVLHGCESTAVARRVQELTGASVLATWHKDGEGLEDGTVLFFVRRLLRELTQGMSLAAAWQNAAPSVNEDYLFLEGLGQAVRASTHNEVGPDGNVVRILRLEMRLEGMEEEQARQGRGIDRNRDDLNEIKTALGGVTIRLEDRRFSPGAVAGVALALISVIALAATALVILLSGGG